jgi:signal transduction histidine kinase
MDAAGFCSAARWYVEGYGQRSGLTVSLELPDDLGRLPDAVELALFRVLQEAMTNVHRHSGASAAEVRISKEAGEIILQVKDNGCGIPLALLENFQTTGMGMGVGLAGIRERVRELGGKLILQSEPACTSIQVRLPLTTISSTDSPIPVPQPRSDARKSASPEGAEEQNASSLAMSAAKP